MNTKAFKTWLLITYLAVLLSSGDALHRLPCFGHHHAVTAEDRVADSSGQCSCSFHASACSDGESQAVGQLVPAESRENHSCLICEFFDEYQASIAPSVNVPMESPYCAWFQCEVRSVTVEQTIAVARGPPVA